ncbi:MAG: zinc-dependent metalloprotease [Chitinophagaceae bacterium]
MRSLFNMKNHLLFITALCLLVVETTFSQPVCGFDGMHTQLLKDDPAYRARLLNNEAKIRDIIRNRGAAPQQTLRENGISAALYTIPVVVHVVHTGGAIGTIYNPSDAQITGAISYLNQVFNGTYPGTTGVGDIDVQFVLASRDPNCNPSTGIDRIDGSSLTNYASDGVNSSLSGGVSDLNLKNFDRWDPAFFYNIWVVNKIDTKDGTAGQFVAGYAYFAGSSASRDGTVMLATQMGTGKKTLPHEIGHALNLYHPFEGSPDAATCAPVTAGGCSVDGDAVCDTDPITYNQMAGIVDFTPRTGTNGCTGTAYSINTERNYMNYTSSYTLFTAGQKARMQAAMSLPGRVSLATSMATGSYPINAYASPAAACASVTSATGVSANYAGIISVAGANKTITTGAAGDDAGYVDKSSNCMNVFSMQRGSTYNFSATVLAQNYEQLRVWIDYNNNGIFDNTTEQIYINTSIPQNASVVTVGWSFTVPLTAVTNTVLRMRLVDDLIPGYPGTVAIASACHNPVYGQTEDYGVVLSALLPVKFDYFNGVRKDAGAYLSWKTSFEQNTKEFAIEKSTDGIVFSNIGVVPAANVPNGNLYSFTDNNISAPVNYYRLRQIDTDLRSELSKTVAVRFTGEATKLKIINNPVGDQLNIVFNGTTSGNSRIQLFDIAGRKVFSKDLKTVNGQLINIDLAGFKLKTGTYILQTQTGNDIITRKIIKQ